MPRLLVWGPHFENHCFKTNQAVSMATLSASYVPGTHHNTPVRKVLQSLHQKCERLKRKSGFPQSTQWHHRTVHSALLSKGRVSGRSVCPLRLLWQITTNQVTQSHSTYSLAVLEAGSLKPSRPQSCREAAPASSSLWGLLAFLGLWPHHCDLFSSCVCLCYFPFLSLIGMLMMAFRAQVDNAG